MATRKSRARALTRPERASDPIEILFANKSGHIVLAKVRGMRGVSNYLVRRVSSISPASRRGEKLLLRYTETGRVIDITQQMWDGIKEYFPLCRTRANLRRRPSRRSRR